MNPVARAVQAVLLVLVFAAGVLAADMPPEEKVVSLQEAISLALKGNPGLRAMERNVQAGSEEIGVARSRLLPKVTFEERYMRTDNPTYAFSSKLNQQRFEAADFQLDSLNAPEDIGDFQTSVSLEQLVYARRAYLGVDMTKKEVRAAGHDLERKRESVTLQVVNAYMNVRTAREFVRAARQGVEDAKEHKRIAQARFDAGLGLYSDTLRTDVFEKEAEERLIRAEKDLNVAKRALGLLMGLDGPVDIRDDEKCALPLELEYYLEAARGRSDLDAMRVRVENAGNAVKLAGAGYLPTVGIGGSYQYNDHQQPFGTEGGSYQVMAFLRWDIFDGMLRRHERAKAKFKEAEAREFLDGLEKEVRFRVYEAYLGVEEARQSLELAKAREAMALEGKRLVTERYENSLATVVELLDAQSSLDAARADVALKGSNYLIAVAELKFQSGLILEDYLSEE